MEVNTRPLLQDTDSDNSDEHSEVVICNGGNTSNDTSPLFKPHEPQDKYYLCYIIFYLLGITTLLPWNFFITADDVSTCKYTRRIVITLRYIVSVLDV